MHTRDWIICTSLLHTTPLFPAISHHVGERRFKLGLILTIEIILPTRGGIAVQERFEGR